MPSTVPFLDERLAEAARYALMRRLLPAIRHNMAGSLQPIGMMAALLERRMKAATPDLAQLGKNSQAMNTLAREAAATSARLMTWLAPRDNDRVAVNSEVKESLGLMATELAFRGFSIVNQTAEVQMELPRGVLRSVFTASLIALTDTVEGAAQVVVTAQWVDCVAHLQIALEPDASAEPPGSLGRIPTYRSLGWDDVQALAAAECASVSHDASSVQLRCLAPA